MPPTDPVLSVEARPVVSERAAAREAAEAALFELEERRAHLCAELAVVEERLRELRMVAEVCPLCGGSGMRTTRGGLYGELQQRPCACRG